jgi:hypothetical protein
MFRPRNISEFKELLGILLSEGMQEELSELSSKLQGQVKTEFGRKLIPLMLVMTTAETEGGEDIEGSINSELSELTGLIPEERESDFGVLVMDIFSDFPGVEDIQWYLESMYKLEMFATIEDLDRFWDGDYENIYE